MINWFTKSTLVLSPSRLFRPQLAQAYGFHVFRCFAFYIVRTQAVSRQLTCVLWAVRTHILSYTASYNVIMSSFRCNDVVHLVVCMQIPACLDAKGPDDCVEKRTKIRPFCNAIRSGIFHVAGRPLVLHVGQNAQNAMSCMIQADALLMGCSTFGQVAGLLTKGISLFSTSCDGIFAQPHYRTTPPLAMAERGYLWVPVTGSWRNPILESTELLRGALDEFMATRGGFQL